MKTDKREDNIETDLDSIDQATTDTSLLPSWLVPPLPDFILTGITIFIILSKPPISHKAEILLVAGILLLRMGMSILRAQYDARFHRPFSLAVTGIGISVLVFMALTK